MELLADLPPDHPDRRRPLVECWYRHKGMKAWHHVESTFAIAGACYNSLGETWTRHDDWCWNPEEKPKK